MARKRDRAIAGFFAVIFIISISTLTGAVIYTLVTGDDPNKTNAPKEEKMDNFTPTTQPLTELKIEDTKPGTGAEAKAGDTITADYTGAVMSTGTVFDSSIPRGQPATFPLTGVIQGWQQGVPGMKEGGTRRLLIPAALAYGATPPPGSNIPPNADLVFDITLRKVGQ